MCTGATYANEPVLLEWFETRNDGVLSVFKLSPEEASTHEFIVHMY